MDPLTQGVLGAALPQAVTKKRELLRKALPIGFISGMLPDLDVLITSKSDPLLYLEYHRQFSHSLIFIPFGGLIAALLLWPFFRKHLKFPQIYTFATLGYATHGLLDACTTYGTLLLWPFSDMRVSWNVISIIDPLFTLPILILILASAIKKSQRLAQIALAWAFLYLGFGLFQHERAKNFARDLAESRGHSWSRLDAKPSFANLWLWKLVYETEEHFYVDAVHVLISPKLIPGEKIQKLVVERDFPDLDPNSTQRKDIERFRWFSNDYLAVHPGMPDVIGDVRYSLIPNSVNPMWGIRISKDRPDLHVPFEFYRDMSQRDLFLKQLFQPSQLASKNE